MNIRQLVRRLSNRKSFKSTPHAQRRRNFPSAHFFAEPLEWRFAPVGVGFAAAVNFGTAQYPVSVVLGDFNGDGEQDLAVANDNSHNVSILLGDGAGGFGAATNFATANGPRSVAVGDFNSDSKLDVAVANFYDGNVSILLGDGAGNFGAATNFGVGSGAYSIAVGDFNGDSKQDLVVANANSDSVSILLGNGTGGFGAATNFSVGSDPYSVTVGDFNGDSKLDVATGNYSSHDVSILLGNGAGSLGTATNFTVGTLPNQVAVGDFNGDGKLDLVTANAGSHDVSILLGDGAGSFGAATNFWVGGNPVSVAVSDFNDDGKLDLAAADTHNNDVTILLGDGAGSFGTGTTLLVGTGPTSVAVGDFNGDGQQDLAVANANSNNVSILLNTTWIPINNNVVTFYDSDGDRVTVSLKGNGSLAVTLVDPLGTGSGSIDTIKLSGTDATSSLSITVKKAAGGDGFVNIGQITSNGDLKAITAKASDLTGTGVDLSGWLAGLTLHDILNGADVTAGGLASQSTKITAHVIGDGTTIDLDSAIKTLAAARVGNGAIVAPSIGSITVKGDKKSATPILGDFGSDITLSGVGVLAGKTALSKLSVTHDISGATISVTGGLGGVGSVSAAEMFNSIISVGYTPTSPANFMGGGTFTPGLSIKSVSVKGVSGSATPTFSNSFIAAAQVGSVKLASTQTNNLGTLFGVLADESIKSVSITTPAFAWTSSGPADQSVGDFHTKLV